MKKTLTATSFIILLSVLVLFLSCDLIGFNKYTSGDKFIYQINTTNKISITGFKASDSIVNIPEKIENKEVSEIVEEAFSECTNLREITIPKTVRTIGNGAFAGSESLQNIYVDEYWIGAPYTSIDGVLYNKKNDSIHTYPAGRENISYTIQGEGSEVIDYAFYGAQYLETINFNITIFTISEYSFAECKNLKQLNLPGNLRAIGDYAFANCEKLEQVIFPSELINIGEYAFSTCTNLVEADFLNDSTIFYKGAFES